MRTIAGLRFIRTTYLGSHAWTDERSGRLVLWLDFHISVPAPRGQRLRSGRHYSPKWKCQLDGASWPWIGCWRDTIREFVDMLDREGKLPL